MRNFVKYLVMCLAFCLVLTGCRDVYCGQRPTDYEHSRWRAETPNIYFDVDEKKYLKIIGSVTYGKIEINGVVTEIRVIFDYGTGIYFNDISVCATPQKDELLFVGKCEFSPDKCVVKIISNKKGFLDDSIKQIVFKREEIPEETPD